MIILEGPDGSGKTTLANQLQLKQYHSTKESTYEDYLNPLVNLDLWDGVADRWIFSEYPYHILKGRDFAFTDKQWQNIILLTLIQNPTIVLCTHKPEQYTKDQYLPYTDWDTCLLLYRSFFTHNHIPFIEYDYANYRPISGSFIDDLLILEQGKNKYWSWWKDMWSQGIGCIGSIRPKVLIVAERLGPNNTNNIPFETGPTGKMITDMFIKTKTLLGDVAITNMVKDKRRSTRQPNSSDFDLLRTELEYLNPSRVLLMGSVAAQAQSTIKKYNIECYCLPHLGYYNRQHVKDMDKYYTSWKKILNYRKNIRKYVLKEVH